MPQNVVMIEVDGVQLAVDRQGHGRPVVCLSAIGHDARDFDPLAARLEERFEFIRVEWPGHGRSGQDRLPASAHRYASLLEGLLRRLGVERPLIIGNSIGGAAAIIYASRHPVTGLVLCDTGGLVEITPSVQKACRLFANFFAAGERGAFWYGAAFAFYYSQVLKQRPAAAQRKRIVQASRKYATVLREAWSSFGQPEADLRDVAAGIDAPTWVAWAKHDKVIPLKTCLPAIHRLKRHTLSVFAAGHTVFLEQPDAFAKGFQKFADSQA